jgi:Na+/proline symporter
VAKIARQYTCRDLRTIPLVIGVAVVVFIALTLAIGVRTYSRIRGRATNYYVAGNAMPVAVVGVTLCAQAFDANGSMGNASLSYSGGFWMGAVIPIGLATCLILTGRWFAAPLHRMRLMTLADFYRRRYDASSETLATILMAASNIVLVAGNSSTRSPAGFTPPSPPACCRWRCSLSASLWRSSGSPRRLAGRR